MCACVPLTTLVLARKIVNALTLAIIPVFSAMFVALLVIAIYAILGVNFFGTEHPTLFGDLGRASEC